MQLIMKEKSDLITATMEPKFDYHVIREESK